MTMFDANHIVSFLCNVVNFSDTTVDMDKVHYCERFLELMVDLEVRITNISYILLGF